MRNGTKEARRCKERFHELPNHRNAKKEPDSYMSRLLVGTYIVNIKS